MDIKKILKTISRDSECNVLPPSGGPSLWKTSHALPDDLKTFYALCGGIELFRARDYGWLISPPDKLVYATPVLLTTYYTEHQSFWDASESSSVYLIASQHDETFITIDLGPQRLGLCYDSDPMLHGTAESKVVAQSFTDLLERLYADKGETIYFIGEQGPKYGYALE